MLRILRSCVLTALLFVTFAALADFHEFRIEQIFSNADGTVQFVVMHNIGGNGEGFWLGHTLTSSDGVSPTKVFPFPSNLPSQTTAGRRVLIATPGFAALGLVTPDYIIPNGFLPLTNGVVNYAGVDQVPPVQVPQMRYAALPTDGRAIDHGGNPIPNVATNFAGASASVQAAPATPGGPPVALVPEKGLWWNPAEDGTGYNFDIKHGVLVMSMFTYESSGDSEWYVAAGPLTTTEPRSTRRSTIIAMGNAFRARLPASRRRMWELAATSRSRSLRRRRPSSRCRAAASARFSPKCSERAEGAAAWAARVACGCRPCSC